MKYVLVGAVAGGATAAARLRRLDEFAAIVMFEKGPHISYANCGLPYYIGNVIKDRGKLLVQTPESFGSRYNVDIRTRCEVAAIDTNRKTITVCDLVTQDTYTETYDKLILSPGASPIVPPLPGIHLPGIFTLRTVTDTDHIKAWIADNSIKDATVVGAGFIGLEMAENLHHLGLNVTIVELGNHVLAPLDTPMAAFVQQHIKNHNITFLPGKKVAGFGNDNNKIQVQFADDSYISTGMVVMSVGVRPDTSLARNAGLQIGNSGGIVVNKYLQTSSPDVYALGDAMEFPSPISGIAGPVYLAGPANKQARIVADNVVYGNKVAYKGSVGTAIVGILGINAGLTGLSSWQLDRLGINHLVSTTHSGSHAGYYPGAEELSIQLCYASDTGQLLGAQVVGGSGTDKRLEMISAVLHNCGTVYDLMELEHAYAPQFSSAKDPVNIAGYVAANIISGHHNVVYSHQLQETDYLIDVRNDDEYTHGSITGAVNIPLHELRSRIKEIPQSGRVVVFCMVGQRGYIAQQILHQHGFKNVYNMSGGYKTWHSTNKFTYFMYKFFLTAAFGIMLYSCGNAQNTGNGSATIHNLQPVAFQSTMDTTQNPLLVDVRTSEEYESGHLKGAINIDFRGNDFRGQIQKLDKKAPIFVYCHSGNRSGQATEMMRELGFSNVSNLTGGIAGWEAEGRPVTTVK